MDHRKRQNVIIYIILACVPVIILVIALASSGSGGISVPSTTQPVVQPSQGVFQPGIEGRLSPIQQTAYDRLVQSSSTHPTVRVENGVLRFTTMTVQIPDGRGVTPAEKALVFLQDYSDLFDITAPSQNLSTLSTALDEMGNQQVIFSQAINNVPIYGSMIRVQLNANDEITLVNGGYTPGTVTVQSPSITSQQAEELASQNLVVPTDARYLPTELIYVDDGVFSQGASQPRLSWIVIITDANGIEQVTTIVDALTGEVLRQFTNINEFSVVVWDNDQKPYNDVKTATQIMDDSGCIQGQQCDQDAQDAWQYARAYGDFLYQLFNRNGYDGNGAAFRSYTHGTFPKESFLCPGGSPNAAWVSDRSSTFYSDGFSHSPDIVFHEWTHALISDEISSGQCDGLCYERQSGALNESYADVFGVLLDNAPDGNNWLSVNWQITDWEIGELLSSNGIQGPYRDLSNPSRFSDPDHMTKFQDVLFPNCWNDNGNVHSNSGIPNKAAYLLLQNGQQTFSGVTVHGIGPLKVAYIYYRTITNHLTVNASFRDARDATMQACVELVGQHGITTKDCLQVGNAFAAVGIGNTTFTPPDSTVPPGVTGTPPLNNPIGGKNTSTVLIFDTSGSMDDPDPSGMNKLEAARQSGNRILDILEAEQQAGSSNSQISIVAFSTSARVDLGLTSDVSAARTSLQGLYPDNLTGMPDGLKTGIEVLTNNLSGSQPIIILLSDGLPNVGLGGDENIDESVVKQQVLDLASQAGSQGICIYTVGFGDPTFGSIDEGFLSAVAQATGCGTYYNAQNATQLSNVYVELRHTSTGSILLNQSGNIAQGEQLLVGTINVPTAQGQMLYTLNWPGSQLEAILIDPQGRQVISGYQGASFSTTSSLASVIVQSPLAGQWQVLAKGLDVPEGITTYNAVLSVRPSTIGSVATMPASPGFPIALLILALAGGAVAVYVLYTTTRRNRTQTASGSVAYPPGAGQLVIIKGPNVGQPVPMRDGLTIGRNRYAGLCLMDASVSRQHAVIRYSQGNWFIQDQGSNGGTYVNGQRVTAARLNPGDRVDIGGTTLEFR